MYVGQHNCTLPHSSDSHCFRSMVTGNSIYRDVHISMSIHIHNKNVILDLKSRKITIQTSEELISSFVQHGVSSLGPLLTFFSVEGLRLTCFFRESQFSVSFLRGTCWLFPTIKKYHQFAWEENEIPILTILFSTFLQ